MRVNCGPITAQNSLTSQIFPYGPEILYLDTDRRHGERDLWYYFIYFLVLERERMLPTPHTCLISYSSIEENFLCHPQRRTRLVGLRNLIIISSFQVKEVFEESPFLVPEDSVSIMDGSHEGTFCKEEKVKAKGDAREIFWVWDGKRNCSLTEGNKEKVWNNTALLFLGHLLGYKCRYTKRFMSKLSGDSSETWGSRTRPHPRNKYAVKCKLTNWSLLLGTSGKKVVYMTIYRKLL